MNNIDPKSTVEIITQEDGSQAVQITPPVPSPTLLSSDEINARINVLLNQQASLQKSIDRINEELAILQPIQISLATNQAQAVTTDNPVTP